MFDMSPAVKSEPYEEYNSVQQKQPSKELEIGGHSAAKMPLNHLQAAVP